jgi:hypothetical protein
LSLNFHTLRIVKSERDQRLMSVLDQAHEMTQNKADPTPYLLSQILLLLSE